MTQNTVPSWHYNQVQLSLKTRQRVSPPTVSILNRKTNGISNITSPFSWAWIKTSAVYQFCLSSVVRILISHMLVLVNSSQQLYCTSWIAFSPVIDDFYKFLYVINFYTHSHVSPCTKFLWLALTQEHSLHFSLTSILQNILVLPTAYSYVPFPFIHSFVSISLHHTVKNHNWDLWHLYGSCYILSGKHITCSWKKILTFDSLQVSNTQSQGILGILEAGQGR